MSRPADWAPLTGGDPVPGDPEQVSRTATRCRNTAAEIRDQAAALRRLASADGWEAEAAVMFRAAAVDTATKLDQAHHRYDEVAGALRCYAPALDAAQASSLRALQAAQAAEADARAAAVAQPTGELPPDATDEQRRARTGAVRRAEAAADDADARLAAARRLLDDAVAGRDDAAEAAARRINAAIDHDGLKDSRWERFKNWVHDNAGWISVVSDVLSWIATGLFVLALFIPGVNLITWAIVGLTLLALAGHSLLAASGEGSWVDVGIDVFALATFGAGRLLGGGAKAATAASRTAAASAAGRSASRTALAGSSAQRAALGRLISRRTTSAAARRGARAQIATLKTGARGAGNTARAAELARPLSKAVPLQRLLVGGGDDFAARAVLDARHILGTAGDARAVRAAAVALTKAGRLANVNRAGAIVEVADKFRVFEPLKQLSVFRFELGSRW